MSAPLKNQFAKGNPGGSGREPFYKSLDEMVKRIDEYFKKEKIWTIPGLAYHLGFADKQSLCDYEKKEVFFFPIKRAKLKIEDYTVKQLFQKNGVSTSGPIFILKNMGYSDSIKQDIDLSYNLDSLSEDQLIIISNNIINATKNESNKR